MVGQSLNDAVAPIISARGPEGEGPIARAHALTRKVILDFRDAPSRAELFGKNQSIGEVRYKSPIDGSPWELGVRRDFICQPQDLFPYLGSA